MSARVPDMQKPWRPLQQQTSDGGTQELPACPAGSQKAKVELSWGVRTEFDACPGEGRKGNLVEAMLTETRDMAEPRWFFAQALKVALSR